MKNSNSKNTTIVLSSVLAIAILVGGYFGVKTYSLSNSNEQLTSEVSALDKVKADLLADIEQMQSDYDMLLTTNSELESNFTTATFELAEKNAEIAQFRSQSKTAGLGNEVVRLRELKAEYAFVLYELIEQSTILSDANSELQHQNADLIARMKKVKNQNEELATKVFDMQRKHRAVQVENNEEGKTPKAVFASKGAVTKEVQIAKATNFTFDIRKKKGRPTGSAKRAKKIAVRFDIKSFDNMPSGNEELYLVVQDINGMPVQVDNPGMVTIGNMNEKQEIIVQQTMNVNLTRNHSLKFEFIPKKKTLKEGYYRASVYSKKGLMGSDEFYLR